jgi:outer membrane protein W
VKKTRVLVVVVLAVVIVLKGQLVFAQEKRFAVGVRAAYNSYEGGDIELFLPSHADYDIALGISAGVTYFFSKSFSLELDVGRQETTMKVEEFDVFFGLDTVSDYGELTQIPVLLTGRYHFAPSDKTTVYVGLGIGYYIHDMKNADGDGDFFDGAPPGVNAFADDGFGYHVNTGMECFLSPSVALNIDLKYVMLDVDIGFKGAGYDVKDNTSLNAFVTGFGIKYYF